MFFYDCSCFFWFCFLFCSVCFCFFFFFSSRRRHTRCLSDWSSDVCSSDLVIALPADHYLTATERRDVMLDLGDVVQSLGGSYGVAEDVGTTAEDMLVVSEIGRASCRERV